MSSPSWSDVQPLVLRSTRDGANITVMFCCPETGFRVASRGRLASSAAPGQIRNEVGWMVRRELAMQAGLAIGGGWFGQIARQTVDQALRPATIVGREQVYDEDAEHDAIVGAFRDVQHHFRWDGRRFVAAQAPAAEHRITSQLGGAPQLPPARTALPAANFGASSAPPAVPAAPPASAASLASTVAKLLLTVAGADGRVSDDERELIGTFHEGPLPVGAPSHDELLAVPADRRAALWALATAVALSDHDLSAPERSTLDGWADVWGLDRGRRSQLERESREHVVALAYQDAWRASEPSAAVRSDLRNLALRLGVSLGRITALEADARAHKAPKPPGT